ncbi:MAG: prepilin-type N-terminal cleavage/methylation domain-containing protein [bacterium]
MERSSESPGRTPAAIETGFTLVEVMLVAALGSVLLATATISIGHVLESTRGDAALAGVLSRLRQARDLATNRRRTMQVGPPERGANDATRHPERDYAGQPVLSGRQP